MGMVRTCLLAAAGGVLAGCVAYPAQPTYWAPAYVPPPVYVAPAPVYVPPPVVVVRPYTYYYPRRYYYVR